MQKRLLCPGPSGLEEIAIKDINKVYERMLKGDVHYRFVIDMATL